MEKLVLTIPTLFGDHHTTAVRAILEKIDGVGEVYVSSAFKQVALAFDPKKVKAQAIEGALAEQGYAPGEEETAFAASVSDSLTRHTAAHSGVGDTISFAEPRLAWEGRPLWPCPGFDPQPMLEEEGR